MVDLKRAGERLQSARLWILHAQEAFDKEKDIRGELNLLLAQAELRRVHEASRSGKWRHKYSFLCQIAAAGLAILMVTVGIGGAYWLTNYGGQSNMPHPVVYHDSSGNQPAQTQPTIFEKSVKNPEEQSQHKAPQELAPQLPAHQTVSGKDYGAAAASHEEKAKEKVIQDNVVSPDEMQKLVRTAGKSLRGQ